MKKRGKLRYRKAVFVVTYKKQKGKDKIKYLLLKRKLHWKGWEFPKGGIKTKEQIKKAISREIREETGQIPFNIKSYNLSGKFRYDKKYPDRPRMIGQSYKLYSAEIKNKKIKIDKIEHSSFKWLAFKQALKKLTWPNQKKCLRIVNKKIR